MNWWHRLWRRAQMEQQLEKELRFHLDQHTASLIALGHDPQEARRQATLALGGREQVKENCRDARGTRWVEDLAQDVRYALRTLRQRPGFAAVALLTLALGSGATTVMFTIINGVLLKPLSYPNPDRLLTLHEQRRESGEWPFSYLNFLDCRRETRSFAHMAAWRFNGGGTMSEPGQAEYVPGRQISAELFSALGVNLLQGRAFRPEEDRPGAAPVIVISHRLWQRLYNGSQGTLGRQLVFGGRSFTVVGIAPAAFRLSGDVDVFTPLGQNNEPVMHNREIHPGIRVVARLRPGVTMAQAQSELASVGHRLSEQYPDANAGLGIVAQPLRQELVAGVRSTLWLLLAAVSMVLLIACANVASLLLARAVSRERELGVRAALGAGRGRLIRQCLTESVVLGLGGGLLGVLLAAFGIHPFVVFWPGSLPRAEEVQLDWQVLAFALTASLLTGLLFGLAPALRAPAFELAQTLRAGARTVTGGSRRLHSGFVISEIALAIMLLVVAGMLGRMLLRLSSLDPGLNVRNVLTARVALSPSALTNPASTRAAWQDILDRIRQLPGVQSVALTDLVPMDGDENEIGYSTTAAAPSAGEMPLLLLTSVTPDYRKAMGIALRQGRFLNEHDRIGNQPVAVIDDVLAQRAFRGREPVGQTLWLQFLGPVQVVGVVGHVRHFGLDSDDRAKVREQLYLAFNQCPGEYLRLASSAISLVVRTTVPPLNEAEAVGRQVRGTTRDQAIYEVRTMEQIVSGTLARQRFLLLLFGIFASLALLLACIGVYGVLAYLTNQRVPEFGVRMALGASAGDVMRLVLRQSLGMIFVGSALGAVVSLAAGHLLERLVSGVQSADPLNFTVMIIVLLFAALLASFLPARRASRLDPLKALRQE